MMSSSANDSVCRDRKNNDPKMPLPSGIAVRSAD
jgi:hypothetical protein